MRFEGGTAIAPDTDLVIVRENTEGFYADRNTYAGTGEYMPTADVAITMGVFTRPAIERIARTAFELARRRRSKVTIVHKANVLQLSSGLFKRVCLEVAEGYPDVAVDDFHIDAMTVHLLRRASSFDVVVAENMFGDILSDMAGELAGSLGIAPSINASDDRCMAQAAHGSAPDIAGKGLANPIAMILSAGMLLDWLGTRHDDARLAGRRGAGGGRRARGRARAGSAPATWAVRPRPTSSPTPWWSASPGLVAAAQAAVLTAVVAAATSSRRRTVLRATDSRLRDRRAAQCCAVSSRDVHLRVIGSNLLDDCLVVSVRTRALRSLPPSVAARSAVA